MITSDYGQRLIMTELSHIQNREKTDLAKFELEVIDMDGVKIDKVMVKSLRK
jgi:putative hemolysin